MPDVVPSTELYAVVLLSDIRELVGLASDCTRRDEAAWERMWRLAGYEKDPHGG
jgi:hypothetical protein